MVDAVIFDADLTRFSRELRALDRRLGPKIVRKAAREGGKVLRDEIRASVPVGKTGTLRRSLAAGRRRGASKPGMEIYSVYFRQGNKYGKSRKSGTNKDGYYAHWVEYGHKNRDGKTRSAGSKFAARALQRARRRAMKRFERVLSDQLRGA